MRHNIGVRPFAAATVDKCGPAAPIHGYGYVRLEPNITYNSGRSGVRVRRYSRGDSGLVGRLIHNLGHNNIERPVQSPPRRPQPLDPDVVLAPASLEVVPVPVVDGPLEVEGTAISEVETGPQVAHSAAVYTAGGAA